MTATRERRRTGALITTLQTALGDQGLKPNGLEDTAPRPPSPGRSGISSGADAGAAGESGQTVDVLVVGAGVAGLTTELQRTGCLELVCDGEAARRVQVRGRRAPGEAHAGHVLIETTGGARGG